MANYNETTGPGTMWTRCYKIVIENPYLGLTKKAQFFDENVVVINNRIVQSQNRLIQKTFDPSASIQMLDPATNQPTGETVTHQELYNILYSLYIASAVERDQQEQNP